MISSAGALKNVVALAVGFVAGLKHDEQVHCDALCCMCVKFFLFLTVLTTCASVEQQGCNHAPRPC
jgi:hypothetical protein